MQDWETEPEYAARRVAEAMSFGEEPDPNDLGILVHHTLAEAAQQRVEEGR